MGTPAYTVSPTSYFEAYKYHLLKDVSIGDIRGIYLADYTFSDQHTYADISSFMVAMTPFITDPVYADYFTIDDTRDVLFFYASFNLFLGGDNSPFAGCDPLVSGILFYIPVEEIPLMHVPLPTVDIPNGIVYCHSADYEYRRAWTMTLKMGYSRLFADDF